MGCLCWPVPVYYKRMADAGGRDDIKQKESIPSSHHRGADMKLPISDDQKCDCFILISFWDREGIYRCV